MSSPDLDRFEGLWQPDGSVHEHAPEWAKMRADIRSSFPSYYRPTGTDPFAETMRFAVGLIDTLKPEPDGPAYLGYDPSMPDYEACRKAQMPEVRESVEMTISQAVSHFQGLPNYNHPLAMMNVIPPGNLASIVGATMAEMFLPNIIEGEYSWRVACAEIEAAAMVARMIGWNPEGDRHAGGIFTFGGSGCWLYGLKYSTTHVLGKESRSTGIRTDAKVLLSQQSHYCRMNATDWTGLGMNNILQIETNVDTNAMDITDFTNQYRNCVKNRVPIAAVVCTAGTTDAFAVDPIAEVRQVIDTYGNASGYPEPLLYVDAVIGWSWITFGRYDWNQNPLGFSPSVLAGIRRNYENIRALVFADAVGCDFHKVGWSPYNCSLFMIKDYKYFASLMERPGSDYLQERTPYNPGLHTLEVSRSGSYAMAGWSALKFLGYQGFQMILGSILEMQQYLRGVLAKDSTMLCVNPDDYGFVTLFRVYPRGVDARARYAKELADPGAIKELEYYNNFQQNVANKLWDWFRSGAVVGGSYTPYTSYSTGFRPTLYNRDESNPNAVIYALKAFPMNVNITPQSMLTLVNAVRAARDEVEKESTR